MNGMNGLEIADALPKECCLIFTTAYAQYAWTASTSMPWISSTSPSPTNASSGRSTRRCAVWRPAADPERQEVITLKQEYNNVVVPIEEIRYLEAMENYTKIHRRDGKYILSRTSLKRTSNCCLPTIPAGTQVVCRGLVAGCRIHPCATASEGVPDNNPHQANVCRGFSAEDKEKRRESGRGHVAWKG